MSRALSERAEHGTQVMRDQAAEELRIKRHREYRKQLSRIAHASLSDHLKAANLSVAEANARASATERKVGAVARSTSALSSEVEQLKAALADSVPNQVHNSLLEKLDDTTRLLKSKEADASELMQQLTDAHAEVTHTESKRQEAEGELQLQLSTLEEELREERKPAPGVKCAQPAVALEKLKSEVGLRSQVMSVPLHVSGL